MVRLHFFGRVHCCQSVLRIFFYFFFQLFLCYSYVDCINLIVNFPIIFSHYLGVGFQHRSLHHTVFSQSVVFLIDLNLILYVSCVGKYQSCHAIHRVKKKYRKLNQKSELPNFGRFSVSTESRQEKSGHILISRDISNLNRKFFFFFIMSWGIFNQKSGKKIL